MRIGVISDTHIPDHCQQIPKVILDAFKGVDLIVHAGDILTLEVIEELKLLCPQVAVVAGNMDSKAVVKKYPVKQVFEISGYKIGIMHGHGAPANLVEVLSDAFKVDDCDVIIFGHSHRPMNEQIGKILFFNPGSATDYLSGDCTYGIIEINNKIEAKIIKI